MKIKTFITFALALVTFSGGVLAFDPERYNLEDLIYMELKTGRVVIETRPELAPVHVTRIKELARQGFYDGLTFHRVIENFMAQTGDPNGDGTSGSGVPLTAEFNIARHLRGTLSMARDKGDPDSADSQFFIMLAPAPHLDGKYTVWGRILVGMEHIDQVKKGDEFQDGLVEDPDRIISMRVATDVDK